MVPARDFAAPLGVPATAGSRSIWTVSWTLVISLYVFVFSLYHGHVTRLMLLDGDTYWHIATGRMIWDRGAVPHHDPFSHTMPGAVWTAHEWLSEIVLARAHDLGGWAAVVAVTALAFALTAALLMRALLGKLEPVRAVLLVTIAILLTTGHMLARPHMLAMPLLMLWVVGLVLARDAGRTPSLWLLPVMTVWANMHGGFTLGLALTLAFAAEALLEAWPRNQIVATARTWGIFVALSFLAAMLTPHGPDGLRFTWQVLMESNYALSRIGEWASPSFQGVQPLELWLLGGIALLLYQGLKLPPVRLLLLIGLLHISLKHVRYIELLGLLVPLLVAAPFGAQWRAMQSASPSASALDRFSRRLAQPAGPGAVLACALLMVAASLLFTRIRPVQLPESAAPVAALQAARDAGAKGSVLNGYGQGGYLIYSGIPVFVDGRAEMYGDTFMREYCEALDLKSADQVEKLLAKYKVTWTLLHADTPAIALLDRLPQWKRVYADKHAVVHIKVAD